MPCAAGPPSSSAFPARRQVEITDGVRAVWLALINEGYYSESMEWQTVVVVLAAVGALMVWKTLGLVSVRAALEHLKRGAKVLDVRTPEEYQRDHLPGAVNVPLHELEERIAKVAPDKGQPLLLHCLSGGRSGIAARKLRQMGYQQVFNLGGYSRAAKVLKQHTGK